VFAAERPMPTGELACSGSGSDSDFAGGGEEKRQPPCFFLPHQWLQGEEELPTVTVDASETLPFLLRERWRP